MDEKDISFLSREVTWGPTMQTGTVAVNGTSCRTGFSHVIQSRWNKAIDNRRCHGGDMIRSWWKGEWGRRLPGGELPVEAGPYPPLGQEELGEERACGRLHRAH